MCGCRHRQPATASCSQSYSSTLQLVYLDCRERMSLLRLSSLWATCKPVGHSRRHPEWADLICLTMFSFLVRICDRRQRERRMLSAVVLRQRIANRSPTRVQDCSATLNGRPSWSAYRCHRERLRSCSTCSMMSLRVASHVS